MEEIFSGYLPKDNKKLQEIVTNANIVFDSSSIFNLYRYKKETTINILNYLDKVKTRLFLPYMVGLEYHNNRAGVLKQQRAIYSKLESKVEDLKKSISDQFLEDQHSSVEIDQVQAIVNKFNKELTTYLNTCKKSHPNYLISDPIRDSLVKLFESRSGAAPSMLQLDEIYKVAQERFDKKIPPGYKDSKNKDNQYKTYGDQIIWCKYADYIIWHELIQHGKKTNKNTLFICDERKEDWLWVENGYKLGPRPELFTEYKKETGKDFHLMSLLDFFENLKQLDIHNFSEKLIIDIKTSTNLPWKDVVKNAFISLGGTASLNQIYNYIEQNTSKQLTKEWRGTVRKAIYYYCSDRDLYLGKENLYQALSESKYKLIPY
ncbi:PIN-like domain-containing protein [Pseudoalteromonas aurantia]|uniref:PIN like domain-containing protein n=1 Tax=Pseudoalteromonas aurantia TaxID=43654 RepID=A0A5S3V5K1_9GAMM|nr:PIN-like domain-containing protein [Pseudoalteromonas aurantia]TMO66482.1 hypothetical protein CWC19_16275 [Pseudoalteromonas aurantia]